MTTRVTEALRRKRGEKRETNAKAKENGLFSIALSVKNWLRIRVYINIFVF